MVYWRSLEEKGSSRNDMNTDISCTSLLPSTKRTWVATLPKLYLEAYAEQNVNEWTPVGYQKEPLRAAAEHIFFQNWNEVRYFFL